MPAAGPIADNKDEIRILAGARATKKELLSIDYYVNNVVEM